MMTRLETLDFVFWGLLAQADSAAGAESAGFLDIVFSGGIIGMITNVKEKTFSIRVADNVKIEVSRGAVSHVLEKGEVPEDPEQAG